MSELMVCVFEAEDRAVQVASQVPSDVTGLVQDTAVISCGADGSVHAERAANLVENGKYREIFWGMMIALIFLGALVGNVYRWCCGRAWVGR